MEEAAGISVADGPSGRRTFPKWRAAAWSALGAPLLALYASLALLPELASRFAAPDYVSFAPVAGAAYAFFVIWAVLALLPSVLATGPGPERTRWCLFAGLALASWWCAVFYPAIMSFDSVLHWRDAGSGHLEDWHPIAVTLLVRLARETVDTPAFLAFVQSVLFWFGLLMVIGRACRPGPVFLFLSLLIAAHPYLGSTSVTIWKDVYMTIALLFGLLLLDSARRRFDADKRFSAAPLAGAWAALSLAIMFRHNAAVFSLLPAWLFFTVSDRSLLRRAVYSLFAAAAVIVPSKLLYLIPGVERTLPGLGSVMSTQYIGTVARLDLMDTDRSQETERFDAVFGAGTFARIEPHYHCSRSGYLTWEGRDQGRPLMSYRELDAHADFFVSALARLVVRRPWAYLRHRACNISHLVWFEPPDAGHYHEIHTNEFGFEPAPLLPRIGPAIERRLRTWCSAWFTRHFVYLPIFPLAAVWAWRRRNAFAALLVIAGTLYFLSYLPVDATADWRYLMPSLLMAYAVAGCMLGDLLTRGPSKA